MKLNPINYGISPKGKEDMCIQNRLQHNNVGLYYMVKENKHQEYYFIFNFSWANNGLSNSPLIKCYLTA